MEVWIARDKSKALFLYLEEPILDELFEDSYDCLNKCLGQLNENEFPEVTFENSPQKVKIELC